MRKTLKTLGLCALAALAIVSCKKNDEKADMTTFAATINQPTNDDRTGINSEFKLTWNDPDVIKVFAADGGASADFTTSDGGQTEANFSGHIANSEEGYCAFYPAANVNTEDNTRVTLTLSPNQTYLNGSFSTNTYPIAAKSKESDKTRFNFHSPCGLLAIPVKGTGTLGSIELTGNSNEKLAGTYTYDMNGTMIAPADYTEDENATKVTLTCGETGLPLNTETAATMYFVLPAVTFSQGFTVVLKGVGDNAPVLYRLSTSKSKKIDAEKYIMMDDVNVSTNGVTTNAVVDTEITSTSATLHGSYANVPNGIDVDEVGFYFGTTASFNENDTMQADNINEYEKTFSRDVENLQPSTLYHYQAYAKSGTTVYTGVENTFTTGTPDPTVTTGTAEATSATAATGHVTLTNAGSGTVSQIGLCWGTTENPTVNATANNFAAAAGQTVNTEYEVAIANLEPATEYHVCGYAKVGDVYYYAESSVTFTTPAAPTVTTGAAAATSANEATGHVTLTNAGSGTVSQIGLCWGTTENPTVNTTANNFAAAAGQTVNTEYEVAIANLEPATEYHVRGYAKVGDDYYYAVSSVTFTTELPGVESFTGDFENGLPEGWTTIDADGDGYNWVLDTECESAYGYNQSNAGYNGSHMILSGSYHKTEGALHPDNYLVSPKVTLRSGSTFSFYAGAQDYQYPAEHFGVFVSDNGTSDWTMVQDWTMTAKGASGNRGAGRDGNTRDQGNWHQYTVDLSAYAGRKYIAIRHFNSSDQFFLNVDNIRLGDPEPGTSFSQNFNNSVFPEGWTTIDADGDGYNWVLTNQMAAYGYSASNDGHYGTVGMTSGSYHGSAGALTPDNYLVTPKVNLVQGSTFSFWACAQDADYPAEHFGVYVSDNGTSGWTMVQEWTMTAKGASGNKGNGRDGNTRDIGNWYQYTVDLSAYAGEKYIAIRHFNCSDEFFLEVDDILLTVNR